VGNREKKIIGTKTMLSKQKVREQDGTNFRKRPQLRKGMRGKVTEIKEWRGNGLKSVKGQGKI